ncbi:MAG: hypothetical protein AMXMBFR57_31470 [Acidimicrobiia bacterium]
MAGPVHFRREKAASGSGARRKAPETLCAQGEHNSLALYSLWEEDVPRPFANNAT